jgi:hypothetical protein
VEITYLNIYSIHNCALHQSQARRNIRGRLGFDLFDQRKNKYHMFPLEIFPLKLSRQFVQY